MRSTKAIVASLMFATVAAQQSRYSGGGDDFGGAGSFSDTGADYDNGGGSGGVSDLEQNIPGVPGDDYPIFAEVPDTSFFCDGLVEGGYYADPEAECQAFHICAADGTGGLTKYSFLCPNGTLFNQQYFVCDWWFNVDCSLAEQYFTLNDQVAAERAANTPAEGGFQPAGAGSDSGAGGRRQGGGQEYQGGRQGGRRGGNQAAASAPRGSYASPDNSADTGYGAPDLGGSLSGYGGRRRNARGLDVDTQSSDDLLEALFVEEEEY